MLVLAERADGKREVEWRGWSLRWRPCVVIKGLCQGSGID